MTATISVIICAWNAERFLGEALASVFEQSQPPDEIIMFDDGSTDRTLEIARAYPTVRAIEGGHAGLAAARNRALAYTTSDLVTFLDADDLLPSDSLATREQALGAEQNSDVVFGACIQFDHITGVREEPTRARLPGTMLARRSNFESVGPFDESLRVGEFIDWWARAEDLGTRSLTIPDVVLLRRNHDQNTTRAARQDGSDQDYLRVVRERLKRRQAAP